MNPQAQVQCHAFARAGLCGNPSDGYYGKTISFVIRQFRATVTLTPADHFEVLPGAGDVARYDSVATFLRDQKLYGYYGGQRLIKAAVKAFHDRAQKHEIPLRPDSYTIAYGSDIPRLVGMSGSSAIVIAALRALMQFHGVQIPPHQLATLALTCENQELRITAGLQDRVVQSFEGMVVMDFARNLIDSRGYGDYTPLKPASPPPLYVAWDAQRAEISDITHRNLRALYELGDATVVGAMEKFRDLTDQAKTAIDACDWKSLGAANNAGFDLRRTIMPIAPENQRMIDVARATGASAAFAGSGGAICGVYFGEDQFARLTAELGRINCRVIKPDIFGV